MASSVDSSLFPPNLSSSSGGDLEPESAENLAEYPPYAASEGVETDIVTPPGTVLNLRWNYNQQILLDFYQKLMVPNFPIQDELEPLENFLVALKAGSHHPFELDIVVGLDGEVPELLSSPPAASEWKGSSPVGLNRGDFKVPSIVGGIITEYYPEPNCGLITYLLVNRLFRGSGVAGFLVNYSRQVLSQNAKARGHLSGCDAIFLETNSAKKIQSQHDVIDPRSRHAILHRYGCRLVDFDYIAPPLSPQHHKVDFLLLTVLLTDHIPHDGTSYYVPSSLVINYVTALWKMAVELERTNIDLNTEPDFRQMIEQLESRERIPLLDLPWGGGRPWTLINMSEDLDIDLLVQFYREFMMDPSEPDPDPLQNWIRYLSEDEQGRLRLADFHVVVAVDLTCSPPLVCGGVAFEYYYKANTGLCTYLFVKAETRRLGLGKLLMNDVQNILDLNAKDRGHLAGCNVVFYEVELVGDDDHAHQFLYRRGLRQLEYDYFTPPFALTDYAKPYLLAVLITDRIPVDADSKNPYLPVPLVRRSIEAIWATAADRGYLKDYQNDRHFSYMMRQCQALQDDNNNNVPIIAERTLPWRRRRDRTSSMTLLHTIDDEIKGSSDSKPAPQRNLERKLALSSRSDTTVSRPFRSSSRTS